MFFLVYARASASSFRPSSIRPLAAHHRQLGLSHRPFLRCAAPIKPFASASRARTAFPSGRPRKPSPSNTPTPRAQIHDAVVRCFFCGASGVAGDGGARVARRSGRFVAAFPVARRRARARAAVARAAGVAV